MAVTQRLVLLLLAILLCLTISCKREEKSTAPPKDLTELALALVNSMVAGDFKGVVSGFTSEMKEGLPAEKLADTWASVISANGPFRQLGGVRAEEVGGFKCIFVKCEFRLGKLDAKAVFDKDKKIAGLWLVKPDPTKSYEPVAQTAVKPAEQDTAQPQAAEESVRLAKELVERLSSKDYAAVTAYFGPKMRESLPAEKIKQVWEQMLSAQGPFVKQVKTRAERSDKFDIVYVTVQLEKSTLDVKVVFSQDRKVSGLWLE